MKISWLSMKLAAAAALAAAGFLLALWAAADAVPWWGGLAGALFLGGAVYAAAHRMLARRLRLAHATLRQIRRHQFANLEAAQLPHGDELNALIWQVYRTGQTLEKEIRELKKIENYRREFVSNVSHELKTPIFAVQGFSETLLAGALEDERVRRRFVEKILRNANRLNNLARDLSEIAHIETGMLQMTAAPFDVVRLAREVNESLEPAAAAKEVTLQHQLPGNLPPVMGDRERIRQVLTNLVDNAIKYNNAGGTVEVVARVLADGRVKTSVVDDGIGVAPEHVARLTERFYRADQSRSRSQGGTGLGLAIVKHILGAHGSELMVESTPGRGSTFGFVLPAAEAGAEEEKEAPGEEAGPEHRAAVRL